MSRCDPNYVCIGVLVCLCLLNIIASPFVLMHGANAWTKVLPPGFHKTQCSLTHVNVTSQYVTCACNESHGGEFPCVLISVKVTEQREDGHQMEKQDEFRGLLYHSVRELQNRTVK